MKHETELSSPVLSSDSSIHRFADSPIQSLPSLRIMPTDWTAPLDLPAAFGRAPQRLEVDLGCGKGRFLLARAAAHPETSFLGLDRQTRRLAKVERKAQRAHLANIRLLYAEAAYAVTHLLP